MGGWAVGTTRLVPSSPVLPTLSRTRLLPCNRTPAAGKTYANCFMRSAMPPSKRCAKSYDVLRYNVSADSCRTIVSHDDFSVSQFLPPEAATITQLRRWGGPAGRVVSWWLLFRLVGSKRRLGPPSQFHLLPTQPSHPPFTPPLLLSIPWHRPIDRVISAYEFAVDIAAKGVQTPDQRLRRPSPKAKPDFVGTLDVWPWSYLIPYFKQDMNQRVGGVGVEWLRSFDWRHSAPEPDAMRLGCLSPLPLDACLPTCLPACLYPSPLPRPAAADGGAARVSAARLHRLARLPVPRQPHLLLERGQEQVGCVVRCGCVSNCLGVRGSNCGESEENLADCMICPRSLYPPHPLHQLPRPPCSVGAARERGGAGPVQQQPGHPAARVA